MAEYRCKCWLWDPDESTIYNSCHDIQKSEVGSRKSEVIDKRDTFRPSPPLWLKVLLLFTQTLSRMSTENTSDFEHLREKFGRFRILIIGRANSGKTTILRRICDTTENPEIYDGDGNKVCIQVDVYRRVYAKPRD